MQMPGNAIQIVSLLLSGYVSSRWPNMRCIVMITGNLVCVACGSVLVGLSNDHVWGRLVALWLCSFQSVGFAISLTMVSKVKGMRLPSDQEIPPRHHVDSTWIPCEVSANPHTLRLTGIEQYRRLHEETSYGSRNVSSSFMEQDTRMSMSDLISFVHARY